MDAVKVLMVDDEARMRKLVKDFLAIKGYKVIEAEDGEQAVDAVSGYSGSQYWAGWTGEWSFLPDNLVNSELQ